MEKLAILDCGSQFTNIIKRRVRELGVISDILSIDIDADRIKGYKGIIISGGPQSVWDKNSVRCDEELFKLGIPVLGICYGMQLINHVFGGTVSPDVKKEYGETTIDIDTKCILFNGLNDREVVAMSHGDSVKELAHEFVQCASSLDVTAAIRHEKKDIYGVQFHPECGMSINGLIILKNFIHKICNFKDGYVLHDIIESVLYEIKVKVGDNKVFVLVSGGLDSTVCAMLLRKVIPLNNIYHIHIDTGFMRKNESKLVYEELKDIGFKNLIKVNAKDIFFNDSIEVDGEKIGPITALTDPEQKREFIGQAFIKAVKAVVNDLNMDFNDIFLAQGTLISDLIESGNKDMGIHIHKIKTYHNDVDDIKDIRRNGRLVEPNLYLYKDEVKRIAQTLDINQSIMDRQPFPGPGLAIRIICNAQSGTVDNEENEKFRQIISGSKYKGKLLPVKSVGTKGDKRHFGDLSVIWNDNCTLEWDSAYNLSKGITNNLHSVNRVVYILKSSSSHIRDINCWSLNIDEQKTELLREIDSLVTNALKTFNSKQTFCILLPVNQTKKYSVVIRTFVTTDFMSGRPSYIGDEIPNRTIIELADTIIKNYEEIDFVMYDITSKPPATCEWE